MRLRVVLLLAALGLAVAAPAAAAGPLLGGRISAEHLPLVREIDGHWFQVTNQSTIPVRVHLEFTSAHPAGWFLDQEAFTLAVDETHRVKITTAGPEPVTIGATLSGIGVTGTDTTALPFQLNVRHATWFEVHAYLAPWGALGAAVAFLAGLALWRRRTNKFRRTA